MFLYQRNSEYFAQIARGMELIGIEEAKNLGATDITEAYRGFSFKADMETLINMNYKSRLCSRILAPLAEFHCPDDITLYNTAKAIQWSAFLTTKHTFAIFANITNSNITNSQWAKQRLKDAIVDHFKDKFGVRPDVNADDPDVWFNLYLEDNKAIIYLDTSGSPLHRRNYKTKDFEASVQETLASAMLVFAGWDGKQALYDPFCGSGTILTEAMMIYSKIPAGFYRRKWGFTEMPEFDPDQWMKIRKAAKEQIIRLPKDLICGSDISKDAVDVARENKKRFDDFISVDIRTRDFRKIDSLDDKLIIANPPYGKRLGQVSQLKATYKDFGDFLKQKCKRSTAWILCGEKELQKSIGLRAHGKHTVYNGAIECSFVKYDLY